MHKEFRVGAVFNYPGMTAYPNDTCGALVKVRPTARTYIMGGVKISLKILAVKSLRTGKEKNSEWMNQRAEPELV